MFLDLKMQHQKHVRLSKVIYKCKAISKWQLFIFCCKQANCKDHKKKKKQAKKKGQENSEKKNEKGEETTLNNIKTPQPTRKENWAVLT